MPLVICMVPVAPIRKEAAHRSEMVSQLLFGEMAEILEEEKDFTYIRCVYDNYEGWCQTSQLVNDDKIQHVLPGHFINPDWSAGVFCNDVKMMIPLGASLGPFAGRNEITAGPFTLRFEGKKWDVREAVFNETSIRKIIALFLNTAYLWGGRSVFGIDCSGFVQQVYHFFNKRLPRDAWQQAEEGEPMGFLQEAVCGDLAFFDNADGRIVHVGIMLNAHTIVHSAGKVRIDPIDNMGIINADTGQRTHKLRMLKRYHNTGA